MTNSKMPIAKMPEKWKKEQKVIKAIQVAFDLEAKVQYLIRKEALELDINPSERVRQIIGLPVHDAPKRPRLSVSLKPDDFVALAKKYHLDPQDKKSIKHKASLELQAYFDNKD